MATKQYKFFPFYSGASYTIYDVINGYVGLSGTRYYYGTQDSINQHPNSSYIYQITNWSRDNDKATVFFNKTGSGPNFAVGSIVTVSGSADKNLDYTGMVLVAGPDYIQFLNPGYTTGYSSPSGAITANINPAWTTGFYFIPSYESSFDVENRVIEVKFGDGYSQTQRDGLNSDTNILSLNFNGRNDKEARAITNFIKDKGGVEQFRLLIPVGTINNDPTITYKGQNVKVTPSSFGVNNVTVTVKQSFDP